MWFGRALFVFFFQAEDGIRDLVRSRGLGDVYKRQVQRWYADPILDPKTGKDYTLRTVFTHDHFGPSTHQQHGLYACLLYTSDAADERSSVDLGGRRIIKKKKKQKHNNNTQHEWQNSHKYEP